MEIKYKLYPYPVLSTYSDNYKQGSFDVMIEPVRDGYNLRIDFVATLTSKGLVDLIKSGKAQYVYHLECAQTGFRKVVKTSKSTEAYPLENKMVNGKLQICPFVVAVEDIIGFSNPDFHDDYAGAVINVEAGCVLAVGKMATLDISKDIDELANTPSVFSIVMNTDTSCRQMLIDMYTRKILIKLPLNEYYCYKQLSKTPEAQSILNSLTIVPALTYVLEELKMLSPFERNELSEQYLWYRVLSRTLATQFDCNIESEEFNSVNSIELAQKLINDPLTDALHVLTTFGNSGGDEE